MAKKNLTPKQRRFVEEYLVDLNATAAALRAGYSAKTAAQVGYQLLQKPAVQEAIQAAMEDRAKRTSITQDRVVAELAKVAFANGANYAQVVTLTHKEDGRPGAQIVELTETGNLTDDQRAAIASIEETKFGIKVSTYDKVRALELLGRHLGMFDGHGGEEGGGVTLVDDI